jgi:NADH:ubiquinone oxidoreductase subunit F (NADH-binding)
MFPDTRTGKYHIMVDTNVAAMLAGSDSVVAALEGNLGIRLGETTPDGLFSLFAAEDLGAGGVAPALLVNDTLYGRMSAVSAGDLVLALRGGRLPLADNEVRAVPTSSLLLRPPSSRPSREEGSLRYRGLEAARCRKPDDVISLIEESRLRGRGGAAFPTGRKWRLARRSGRPVSLVCNADEGEPGAFKDRYILENDPHLLLEGIAIAAHALDAGTAYVYLRGEYRGPGESLRRAARDARRAGLLRDLQLVLYYGGGSYLCGEETALLSSLEGGRGEPRPKPPYPVESGLFGSPTVVNNVETLAAAASVLTAGPQIFRERSPLLFSVCGHVQRPGIYEYPLGTPLVELLEAAGVQGSLKAVLPGGLSSPILAADKAAHLHLDYDDARRAGTALGSGAVIALNTTGSVLRLACRAAEFFAGESCGLCAPCREGTSALSSLLRARVDRSAPRGWMPKALGLCRALSPASLCPGGSSFFSSLETMLLSFPEEFE